MVRLLPKLLPPASALCLTALLCVLPSRGWSGSLDSVPLKPGAEVPAYCKDSAQPVRVTIKADGANGTQFFTPWPIEFVMDVDVGDGKKVMLTLGTDEQWKAMAAGRRPEGDPPLKKTLQGVDGASVLLQRGNYFFVFNNLSDAPLLLAYRCSFVRK
jgi:hypothetical protein